MDTREDFLAKTRARDIQMGVAPYFMHLTTENIPQSYVKKQYVGRTDEVVQIRFPADTRFSPVFPVDAMWTRNGNDVITYAERFADQYRAFVNGDDQVSAGTPLEMLVPYGMTPDLLSYCRTMKIYSIEALHNLEGQNLKNLGMRGNRLKEMARNYMSTLSQGVSAMSEIETLKAEIERLKQVNVIPAQEFNGVDEGDIDDFAIMNDDELRAFLEEKTGVRPDGRWNRERLENMARGAA
jgi:hypothetical protein